MNTKIKILKGILAITIFLLIVFGIYFLKPKFVHEKPNPKKKETYESSRYYHEHAEITKDTKLYQKNGNDYKDVGKVYKGTLISLEKPEKKDQYFKIKDTNYYVFYDALKDHEEKKKDEKYKRWIPFNENVEGENITLYQEDTKVLTLAEQVSLPIYRKTENQYYVEYQNELYFVLKEEVSVVKKENADDIKATEVGVLNYHFFYDENTEEKCNQIICHPKSQFVSHLDYLKENHYTTLTAEELKFFLKGEIQVPKKSTVITIDDGWLVQIAIDLLNEYQMYGTLFLITDWYDPKNYASDYVKIESHSNNMHNTGVCPKGQGGAITCWSDDQILEDLKISQQKIGGSNVFCFPFYEYNNHSIELLKQAGFEMAFIGGNKKAKPGVNLFEVPRYVVGSDTTLNDFIRKIA